MCEPHRPHFIDLTGQQFGELVVVRVVSTASGQQTKWLCRCSCGEEITIYGNKLREARTEGRELACASCKPQPGRPKGSSVGRPPNKSKKICTLCCNLPWQVQGEVCENCGKHYAEEPPVHAQATQLISSANGLYSEEPEDKIKRPKRARARAAASACR